MTGARPSALCRVNHITRPGSSKGWRGVIAIAIACACGVALATTHAGAQSTATAAAEEEAIEPIHFELHIPAGCPGEADFLARLRAHTTKFRVAAEGEIARVFVIELATTASGARGTLAIRDVSGASDVRSLQGATCLEVMRGLALMAALAIDPTATLAPVESASPSASAPASISASAAAPSPSVSAPPPFAPTPSSATRFAFGLAGESIFGLSPSPMFGGNVFAELAIDRSTVVSPSFRLAFHGDLGPKIAGDGGAARISRFVATVDACPLSLPAPPSTFALRPCAQFGGGFVQGTGTDIVDARSAREPWFFVAALLRAQWSPIDRLRVDLALGAALPFERYRFRFDPSTSLYETQKIAAFCELGLALVY